MTKNGGGSDGQEELKNTSSDSSSQAPDSLSKREGMDNETYNKQKLYKEDIHLNAFYDIESSQFLSPLAESSDEFNERYQMSIEGFIRLFAQTSVMAAFLARDFPIGIRRRIVRYIDDYIRLFSDKIFVASESALILHQFIEDIKKHLGQMAENSDPRAWHMPPEYPSAQFKKEHRIFKKEYKIFIQTLNDYSLVTDGIFVNLNDQSSLSKDLVEICMRILNDIHHFGKQWTNYFYGYTNMGHAVLYIYSLFDKVEILQLDIEQVIELTTSLTTRKDTKKGERRLTFTFSPWKFLLRDFTLLFFKFFHEYISHMSASMYPNKNDDGTLLQPIDQLRCEIPDELSEGWMIHTAETFFSENASVLLNNYRHLEQEFKKVIANWIRDIIDQGRNNVLYIPSADTGYTIAARFLRFLQDEIFEDDKKKAYDLYYKLSFDLITRYPINGFSHQDFLDYMQIWLYSGNYQQFIQCIQECLQVEQNRIDLSLLWSKIRYEPDELYLPELYRPPELYSSLESYKKDRASSKLV
jgi:hypothetical protein